MKLEELEKPVEVSNVCNEIFRKYHINLERYIREYLRSNKTTRLDIYIEYAGSPTGYLSYSADGNYRYTFEQPCRIKQRLPIEFRPNLP